MTRSVIDESPSDSGGQTRTVKLSVTQTDHRIGVLCAAAITLSFVDLAIPLPMPGIKPGFANIVILVALNQSGFSTAAWVSLLRVLTVGILIGTLLSPTFMLSLSGALSSLAMLGLSVWLPSRYFSAITQSLLAAAGHLGGQLVFAHFFLIPLDQMLPLLPVLCGFCVLTGCVNGVIVNTLLLRSNTSHAS